MFHGKPIYRWKLPKRGGGGWTVFKLKGEGMTKESGVVFLRGEGLIPQCILLTNSKLESHQKLINFYLP